MAINVNFNALQWSARRMAPLTISAHQDVREPWDEGMDEPDTIDSDSVHDWNLRDSIDFIYQTRTNHVGSIEQQYGEIQQRHACFHLVFYVHNGSEHLTGCRETRSIHIDGIKTRASAERLLAYLNSRYK